MYGRTLVKQLSFFNEQIDTSDSLPIKITQKATVWKMYIDGASRSNPGPAGAGIYVSIDGKPIAQWAFYLHERTNNQAEYYALLLGLYCLQKKGLSEKILKKNVKGSHILEFPWGSVCHIEVGARGVTSLKFFMADFC